MFLRNGAGSAISTSALALRALAQCLQESNSKAQVFFPAGLVWGFFTVRVFTLVSGSYRAKTAGHVAPCLHSYELCFPLFHKRIQITPSKAKRSCFSPEGTACTCSSSTNDQCSCPTLLELPPTIPPSMEAGRSMATLLAGSWKPGTMSFSSLEQVFALNHPVTFHKSFKSSYNTSLQSPMTSTENFITYFKCHFSIYV